MPVNKLIALSDPDFYINRELSWLEFNHRVLEEAFDERNPLLERLKFLCIVSSNLDEFFEVRVAGLKQQKQTNASETGPDQMSAGEVLAAISTRVRQMLDDQYRCWRDHLLPALEARKISFLTYPDVAPEQVKYFTRYFESSVYPVLTPLAVDPVHPFPQLLNKSLNVVVELEGRGLSTNFAIVQVPRILPRVVPAPTEDGTHQFVFIGNIIQHHVNSLFHGVKVKGAHQFRITRNSNLYIDEEEADNLLRTIEGELRKLNRGNAVRLEVQKDCPRAVIERLQQVFALEKEDVYENDGPINLLRLMPLTTSLDRPDLKYKPFVAPLVLQPTEKEDLFSLIRKKDVLLHHPYDSFQTVIDLIECAAEDPQVLAIKQTLYRTGGDSPVVGSLIRAAESGKQVTVIIELKARFDEAANIKWAKVLQEAGVHVVYGLMGLKTHAKLALIVRKEEDGIRRYLHMGTGNYHPSTAKLYTDLGILTCNPDLTNDCAELFNWLTGVAVFPKLKKLRVAPSNLHDAVLDMIRAETENARAGKPASITAKVNALVDTEIIEALYTASMAGVDIKLIVRGVCCLRPQIKGVSDRIQVHSIVGRFLEHSRIYRFENGGKPMVFLGSADWMPRNFFRRVETCFPLEDKQLREQVERILEVYWNDNVRARELNYDKTYSHRKAVEPGIDAQAYFMEQAMKRR